MIILVNRLENMDVSVQLLEIYADALFYANFP